MHTKLHRSTEIDIMGIQEHHLKGMGVIEIRSKDNKDTHELFS